MAHSPKNVRPGRASAHRRGFFDDDEWQELKWGDDSVQKSSKNRDGGFAKSKGFGKGKSKQDDDVDMTGGVTGLSGNLDELRMMVFKNGPHDRRPAPLKLYIPVKHEATKSGYKDFKAACIHSVILSFIVLTQI